MTTPLSERLAGLADEWGAGATAPDAGLLWRAGKGRRVRSRTGAVAGAVVLVLLALAIVVPGGGAHVPASGDAPGVRGYPERIGHQWWTPDLGERQAPVAGLLQSVETSTGRTEWYAVGSSGTLRRLPRTQDGGDTYPALSDDGRAVAFLVGPDGPYLVHDLVTGQQRRFADVTDGASGRGRPPRGRWWVQGQTPAWFSPDSRRIAVPVNAPGQSGVLVLGVDGSEHFVDVPSARVAGWADDNTLLGVTLEAPLRLWTRDIVSGATHLGPSVDPRAGIAPDQLSQWSLRSSPQQHRLLFMVEDPAQPRLGFLDSRTGALIPVTGSPAPTRGTATPVLAAPGSAPMVACGAVAASGRPALTVQTGSGATELIALEVQGEHVLSSVDPALHGRCTLWAQDAVEGSPSWTPFGTSTSWLSWWWREVLGAVAVLVATGFFALHRRRAVAERYWPHG